MDSTSSVSQWLAGLKAGDLAAVEALWERYSARLVEIARQKLKGAPTSFVDEDDVAQSVFHNVCRGASAGRFAGVVNRDELWWLLLRITQQKVIDYIRRETTVKRGGGKVITETAISGSHDGSPFSLELIASTDPTPEFLITLEEQTQRLLELLRNDRLRQIALARIEGFTVPEIAADLAISVRSIERKLHLIRKAWAADLDARD